MTKRFSSTGYIHTGLGATGVPRKGKPKTEEERKATHLALKGTTKLPKRGFRFRKLNK